MKQEKIKSREKSRHFRLEWNCTFTELLEFFASVNQVTSRALFFRANIGEIYLSVKGLEDENNLYGENLTDYKTVEDVLHEWRGRIRLLKILSRKPTPEKRWTGQWINLKNAL